MGIGTSELDFVKYVFDKMEVCCIFRKHHFDKWNMATPHPLTTLPPEDLDFIAELVVRDGSLKDVAASYGVSYPTIRSRFTRVVERTKQVMSGRSIDPLNELLASLVERGELSPVSARAIRAMVPSVIPPQSQVTRSSP